jgi:hypothetical protein
MALAEEPEFFALSCAGPAKRAAAALEAFCESTASFAFRTEASLSINVEFSPPSVEDADSEGGGGGGGVPET